MHATHVIFFHLEILLTGFAIPISLLHITLLQKERYSFTDIHIYIYF